LQPFSFKIPLVRFDTNLLPPGARQIGTEAFKAAVITHLAAEYAAKGQTAIVIVDDEEISVVTVPATVDPLDFVMSMLQSGQIKEAIPYLESLARTAPDDVRVLYNLGIAYSELGQYDEAIIRLKKAVRLEPEHAHAWNGIGVAYQRMGKPEQALEALTKAVEAAPDDGYSLRNLGALLASQHRLAEGVEYLRRAALQLPDDPQTLYGLGSALHRLGGAENDAEADRVLKSVVERFPASSVAELARQARSKLAQRNLRAQVGGRIRPDVMMYIAGALDTFEKLGPEKRKAIGVEIAMLGRSGLDINDSTQKYTLRSLPGKFSGLHLLSMMYTAFRQIDPSIDVGADFSKEYEMAEAMHTKRE